MVPCDLMNEIAENRFSETVTFSTNTNDVVLICLPQSSNFKNHSVLPRAQGSSDIKRERERERERELTVFPWIQEVVIGLLQYS